MSVVHPTAKQAAFWLERIRALPPRENAFHILNVCGGHERSISEAGIRSLLPDWIELVPGPGCPVCVCANEDLQTAIALAESGKILVAYGDMLRVPTNTRTSLLSAKAAGADVRPVASPLEALEIAQQNLDKDVVFFAAGFETSFAPLAAMISAMPLPNNLSFLLAGKLTWPAVECLLESDTAKKIDGLIAPGHVATVMGKRQWDFCLEKYGIPTAVSGFTSESLLKAMYWVLTDPSTQVQNAYAEVVTDEGNQRAQAQLEAAFTIVDGAWRGLGTISDSAYELSENYRTRDAKLKWPELAVTEVIESDMPKGCSCADVVMARKLPSECQLFDNGCTPERPLGPCMVSDEGACQIWYSQRPLRHAHA